MLALKAFKQIVGIMNMSQQDKERDASMHIVYNQYLSLDKEQREAWEADAAQKVKPVLLSIQKELS